MKQNRLWKALQSWRTDVVFEILSDLLYAAFRKGIRIEQDQNPLCVLIGCGKRFVHIDSLFGALEWPEDSQVSANLLDLIEGWAGNESSESYHRIGADLFKLSQTWR